jgi:hypothetical protein
MSLSLSQARELAVAESQGFRVGFVRSLLVRLWLCGFERDDALVAAVSVLRAERLRELAF